MSKSLNSLHIVLLNKLRGRG